MILRDHEIFKLFLTLDLVIGEYAIFGSGVMFALGIRELSEIHDLDVVVTKEGWEKVKNLGKPFYDPGWKCNWLKLLDSKIELSDGWGPGEWNVDELVSTAIVSDGISFVNIENVVKWKKRMDREKDREHVKMIKEYLRSSQEVS